jgi:hypothetical protein
MCTLYHEGPYSPEECDYLCPYRFESVDELDLEEGSSDKRCLYVDDNNCQLAFSYSVDEESAGSLIRVKKERDCALPLDIWIIVGSITGSVFLLGLLVLLVFRYCMYLKDKRDYLTWVAEVEKTKINLTQLGTSPLYKAVNTKYENPMYRAKQS